MGYTHYWTFEPNKVQDTEQLRKRFKRASNYVKGFVKFINADRDKCDYTICGGLGVGKPIISDTEIWFNGDASQQLDHETFSLHWNRPNYHGLRYNCQHGKWNDFCKTARKPYDLVVCFSLLIFSEMFPEGFKFTSDGGMEDREWQKAVDLYEAFTGFKAKIDHLK